MKKALFAVCLSAAAGLSQAQPVIESAAFDYPAVPDFDYKNFLSMTAIEPGPAGADVQWDFSTRKLVAGTHFTTAVCPGDSDCGTFATANQVLKTNIPTKVFFAKSATELNQVGEFSPSSFTFLDPMKVLEFPITYNQTFTDNFFGSGVVGIRSGSVNSIIDGYGTLKTPEGIYYNVLRQKLVENTVATTSGQAIQMKITHYYWMAANQHHYIMSLIVNETVGSPAPPVYAFSYATQESGTSIEDKEALAAAVSLYPNPANNNFTIKTGHLAATAVTVYNLQGQRMLQREFVGKNAAALTLDNLQLAPGCYFVKITTDKGIVTKKVVIR